MDKNSVDWHGSWVALVTPFEADGAIDEAGFARNVDLCIRGGVNGVLVPGCTGEFWALSDAERVRLFALCVEAAAGRVPVIGGTGAIRTADVIAMSGAAKDAGCAGVMVMPPFFVKPSADDIVAHYEAISGAVEIPILLYNIPANNVNPLTPELVDRLADVDCVVAIKESSLDFANFYRTLQVAGDRIRVFPPGFLGGAAALEIGASGYFQTFSNYWGRESNGIYQSYLRGDLAGARRFLDLELTLRDALNRGGRNGYVVIKAAMNLFGRPGGYPRLPLRPLDEAALAEIRHAMVRHGAARPEEEDTPVAAVAE